MKKLRILLTIISLSITMLSQAQTKSGKITGHVADGGQKTIESATITLLNSKDSSVAKITAASKDGDFAFDGIANGKYLIVISAVGHKKAYSGVFEINEANQSIQLQTIELISTTKDLSTVTVVGRRPLVEQKIDRMVVNVEAAVTNIGASALEVLEKSPGVTVDKDGNISLKGKQNVQIFIDGRPSYLSGNDLANLLKSMNADQLDQIEIMTNPPAKYDAAGNSGIINIKTKKNKVKGFNGSANAGYNQGSYWRTNESINLNYRNGKVNLFGNYGYNKNNSYQQLDIHRTYKKPDGKTIDALFDQTAFIKPSNSNNNLKIGMDYFLTNKTTLGFVASGFINPENNFNDNTSYLKNAMGVVDSIVYSTGNEKDRWKNGSLNLNFRHQYDSTGREISFDLDYSKYGSHSNQSFTNSSYDPNWVPKTSTQLVSDLPLDINIYSAKSDYAQPLKKGGKIEAGVKTSYVSTNNAANYFNLVNGSKEIDYNKTNSFTYKENINAAYLNYSKQFKKIGVQAGLRIENTNYKGHQLGNPQKPDSAFSNSYTNAFPTVFISYSADKDNQFGFSLGRRIDRPAYQDLNPFLFFIDNYTYQSGNPFLKPQYSNNIELSHTFKGFLTTTLNYSRTNNYFSETFEQNGFATIVRRGNIGSRQNAGISVNIQIPVAKWWSSSIYTNYAYNHYKGVLYGEQLNVDAAVLLVNVNNQFRFNKGWAAELSGFYRSRGLDGQIVAEPMGQVSTGVSKQVLKGKGSVRLSIRDIFYTNWAKGHINFQQTEASFENKRDSRVAGISFTYRFGKPINGNQNNRKKGGADDEKNRVNVGSGN